MPVAAISRPLANDPVFLNQQYLVGSSRSQTGARTGDFVSATGGLIFARVAEEPTAEDAHVRINHSASTVRFARDKYDRFAMRALLRSLGISLRSATEPID